MVRIVPHFQISTHFIIHGSQQLGISTKRGGRWLEGYCITITTDEDLQSVVKLFGLKQIIVKPSRLV